ncbi:MAG: CotH kinase family protein [Chitinophagia bacterium]
MSTFHRFLLLLALLPNLFIQIALAQQTILTSSDLPIVIINTGGQIISNDPKITASMGIINNGVGKRNNINDIPKEYNNKIGIELRGQSSQMFPMKSYDIELRDAAGSELEVPLLGMPPESDWVLYAPYTDKTLMRNFLAYTLAREMGRWASRCRYVELVVDNDYKGIYLLEEKIKRNTARVNISKLLPTDNSGDELTGGYIFSLDKQPNGWFSSYPVLGSINFNKRQFSYVYPKLADITQPQKDYIKSAVDQFESVLAGPDFQNPSTGTRKYADLNSFIDYFIINELSRNVDGYRLSTYLHKGKNSIDGRIKAGPVWDYDLAFRNANYCNGSDIYGWAYKYNYVCPGDGAGLIPFWWERLMQDTSFIGSLRCRWKELRKTTLSDNHIQKIIDSVVSLTTEARGRHFTRWDIMGKYVWPNANPIPPNYAEEINTLKSWLTQRAAWIDGSLDNSGACGDFPPNTVTSLIVRNYPNPFSGNSSINILSKDAAAIKLRVIDMKGRILMNKQVNIFRGNNSISLGSIGWPSGVYMVHVETEQGEVFKLRILKQE